MNKNIYRKTYEYHINKILDIFNQNNIKILFTQNNKDKFNQQLENIVNKKQCYFYCSVCGVEKNNTYLAIKRLQNILCHDCKPKRNSLKRRLTIQKFIERAIDVHGHKYNYDKSIYIKYNIKLEIICNIHGSFWMTPNDHLNKNGCKQCGIEYRRSLHISNKEEFILKAQEMHGDEYDYLKVIYLGNKIKVEITCYKHGSFWTIPSNHIRGSGCPQCVHLNENRVFEFLTERHINFISQLSKKLTMGGSEAKKKIDFYIPDCQLYIEYNGHQHYQPVKFGGMSEEDSIIAFEKQKDRDEMLRLYCANHGFNLLEIDGRIYHGKKLKKYLEEEFLPHLEKLKKEQV